MKLYTKKGDTGKTFLARYPKKLEKSNEVFNLLGDLDALNCMLSLARATINEVDLNDLIKAVQGLLFCLGSEINLGLKVSPECMINNHEIEVLENLIDYFQQKTGELRNFIVPGVSIAGSYIHMARALTRQAERKAVGLRKKLGIRKEVLAFLNRLSDFLFALGRYVDKVCLGKEDLIWRQEDAKKNFFKVCDSILKG
ncbi:MAG: cob(I)yrinic acid a,c-diamide adenosyltransferase [Deltaproteobacteria bacterium]|nr:cob(I)yrinic acid a,c-diamide adenosyltransferase [Deltaproteobacteria bacterium]MCX7952908.1 cob(I)yrinic acid a,c-diamide adenosyltransferase [Deltaproteobacteria bacterium]